MCYIYLMAKRTNDLNSVAFQALAMRTAERAERVDALRDGRKLRAHTFADRRKVANKRACRGRVSYA